MNGTRFDALTKTLGAAGSRRVALRTLVGSAVATGLSRLSLGNAAAKKNRRKRKKHREKLKKNEFGCVNVGKACRGKDANCCSGICQGKKPKKGKKDKSKCVAHDVLDCPAGADTCAGTGGTCGTNGVRYCWQTTGQASFCGATAVLCAACQKDVDCEALRGPGAACVVCAGTCTTTGGTGCVEAAV